MKVGEDVSKRRCPVEEAFLQSESSEKLQVTIQAVRGWKERKSKEKVKGLREGHGWRRFPTTRYPQSSGKGAKQGGDNFDPKCVLKHS